MDADELLQEQFWHDSDQVSGQVSQKRDTLESLVLSGRGKTFLGGNYTPEDIQQMNSEEILKLYNKYQAVFGGRMARSLSKSMITLYIKLVKTWLPIEEEEDLKSSLEADLVVSNSIGDFASRLYSKLGCYLAPVITALITANHLNFNLYNNINNNIDSNNNTDNYGEYSSDTTRDESEHSH